MESESMAQPMVIDNEELEVLELLRVVEPHTRKHFLLLLRTFAENYRSRHAGA